MSFGAVSLVFIIVSTCASDRLERLVYEMTYALCRAGRKTLLTHSGMLQRQALAMA